MESQFDHTKREAFIADQHVTAGLQGSFGTGSSILVTQIQDTSYSDTEISAPRQSGHVKTLMDRGGEQIWLLNIPARYS